jgi:hypothetical protein
VTTVKEEPGSRDANTATVNMEHHAHAEELELQDRIIVRGPVNANLQAAPVEREFEVVGIIEDSDSGAHFAVCYSEAADEFIVTAVLSKANHWHKTSSTISSSRPATP